MAGPFDLTGQDIENTYQRVLQTDGTLVYDGTGSLVNINLSGSVTSSYALTASYVQNAQTASYFSGTVISASYAQTASTASNSLTASYVNPLQQAVIITGSLNVIGTIDTTNRVAGSIFMHPKTITEDVVVLANYSALLISPVGISGSITLESNADIFIIN